LGVRFDSSSGEEVLTDDHAGAAASVAFRSATLPVAWTDIGHDFNCTQNYDR
jgi:hypothetical protein